MAGRKLTDRSRQLRKDLVESLEAYLAGNLAATLYDGAEKQELAKQVQRVAKYLGVATSGEVTVDVSVEEV